jgi:glutaconate CoA-transferase subunit A
MAQHVDLRDAVAHYIRDGQTLYLAGFTHLIPFAFGHEIIRQGRKHLTLCRATPDLLYDQMIAAGVADRLVFSYAGNPGVGLLQVFRRAVQRGEIEIDEYTHFELVARLEAGAAGLPFWPIRSLENDLSRRRPRPRVRSPFGDGDVAVVPPLRPDVTLLHAHCADEDGNVYAWGLLGEVREAALAAQTVLVSVEEIRPAASLRRERDHLLLPGFRVDSVSLAPWGAHPSYVQDVYDRDTAFYTEWDTISRDPEATRRWLEQYVYGVEDRAAYVKLFSADHLADLREAARIAG